MPVSVDASKTLIDGVSVLTWANKPASADSSRLFLFTDIGSSGTLMRYANSRWRPLAGQAQLAALGAAVTGIANSETIVLQTLIPAGAWQTSDVLRIWIAYNKSGTTDTGGIGVRIGTAGTTADTAITGLNNFGVMNGAGRSGGSIFDIKLIDATNAQKIGSAAASLSHGYQTATSSTASVAATTITSAAANALYVSVTMRSSGTADTIGVEHASIQLMTP